MGSQDLISNEGAGRYSNRQPGGEISEEEALRRGSKNIQPTALLDREHAVTGYHQSLRSYP